jgi:hypothetical protein
MIQKQLRRLLLVCLALGVTCGGRPCLAQLKPVKIKGVVAGVSPQGIAIRTETNQLMLALISPNRAEDGVRYRGIPVPMIEVIGEEKPDYLQPGMYVRFPAKVQAKQRVVEPVTEVTIVDGSKLTAFGVLPAALPDLPKEDAPAPDLTVAEDSLVIGRIVSVSRNAITVAFPDGKTLKASVARNAIVHVKTSDIRFIKPGYLVQAEGMQVKPTKFFATKMTITKPVEAPKGAKPAAGQVADKGPAPKPGAKPGAAKPAVPKPGAAKPATPEKPDPFKIGKPDSPTKPAGEPANVRGRILKIN